MLSINCTIVSINITDNIPVSLGIVATVCVVSGVTGTYTIYMNYYIHNNMNTNNNIQFTIMIDITINTVIHSIIMCMADNTINPSNSNIMHRIGVVAMCIIIDVTDNMCVTQIITSM